VGTDPAADLAVLRLETREKLRDLMSKADRSQELENLLEQVLRSQDDLKSLSGELGSKKTEG